LHDGEKPKCGECLAATDPGCATENDLLTRDQQCAPSHSPDEILAPGAVVGRFIVHRRLGMGGAGVVYAAHDPELDRTIALKVLRRALAHRTDARVRFVREAQSLARLSHPNVISVHDVGAERGCVFIAMEWIDGQTFGDWVAASKRSWREIVAVLVKAGRGLAAAHAAGLVHRDFKPANLLVGLDGRVVVTDFGLARTYVEAGSGLETRPAERPPRGSALTEPVTYQGIPLGTPAYMAPEQRDGQPADPRSDQFSFCVTLHEALFGVHPFRNPPASHSSQLPSPSARADPSSGRTNEPRHVARPPVEARRVPAWLERIAQRGLARRSEDRFPDMDSLLSVLAREPVRRRHRWQLGLAAAALALVGGGLAVVYATATGPLEIRCADVRQQISAVWNPSVAAEVKAAFAGTGRPHARWSAARITERLDGYAKQWADLRRATCLATANSEQSADLRDRRMVCLSRRIAEIRTLLDLFVHRASGELVDGAQEMVANLAPISSCVDAAALFAQVALPDQPVQRARVLALQERVDRADLERQAGRLQMAVDGARAVLAAEPTLDYAPLAAEAGRVLGRSLEDLNRASEARDALVHAKGLAERSGDIRLDADIMLDLLAVIGLREKRAGEGHLLAQLAEGALERPELRHDETMHARLLETLGKIAWQEGRTDQAVDLERQALAIRRRILPPISGGVASAEENLATALATDGRNTEARNHYQDALAIRRRLLGDAHPLTAAVHLNLGVMDAEEGNAADARREYLVALSVLQREPMSRGHLLVLNNLGNLEKALGNFGQARAYLESLLALREKQLGPDHPDVADALQDLGDVLYGLRDFSQALALHRRALEIDERALGNDDASVALNLASLGEDLRRLGHARQALSYHERSLRIVRSRPEGQRLLGRPLACQGLALIDLGRRREAIPVLEKALTATQPDDPMGARAALALARALEPRGPRSRRVRALTRDALAILTAIHADKERDQAADYLAHGSER